MQPLIEDADCVIPLAAYVGAPLCSKDPIGAKTTNHDAIMMMLDMVSDNQWVLMPTTNSAFHGTGDNNNFCDENSPLRPISSYAIEKVAIEKELMKREKFDFFPLGNGVRYVTAFAPRPSGE